MKFFCIGSCRICNFFTNSNPCDFSHTTKEILQLLTNDLTSFSDELRLVNRTFSTKNRFKGNIKRIREEIKNSDFIVLEISSIKSVYYQEKNLYFNIDLYNHILNKTDYDKLKNNQKCLYKLYNNSEQIIKNTLINKQSKNEIYEDLNKIYNLLNYDNKKIILVPHINAKLIHNKTKKLFNIPERVLLCDILKDFSDKNKNIYYFNPMNYLEDDYKQIFDKNSIGHYSEIAHQIIKKEINIFISNL